MKSNGDRNVGRCRVFVFTIGVSDQVRSEHAGLPTVKRPRCRKPSDDIARAMMQLAGSDLAAPVFLSPEEREAIARSKAAASSGEFASDEQVRAVWAKYGL